MSARHNLADQLESPLEDGFENWLSVIYLCIMCTKTIMIWRKSSMDRSIHPVAEYLKYYHGLDLCENFTKQSSVLRFTKTELGLIRHGFLDQTPRALTIQAGSME